MGRNDAPPEVPATLGDAAVSGIRWASGAKVLSEVLAVSAAVALARLIPPAEFGRAAVAQMLMPLAVILTFEGFASALVQRKEDDRALRETAMLMCLVTGALLSVLALVVSWTLAPLVFGDATAHLLALMSPVFLIAAGGAVPRALLWRALDFRRVLMAEVIGLVAGTSTAVGLAVAGLDAKALIYGSLVMAGATTVFLVATAPRVTPRWHAGARGVIGGFGVPAALAGLVSVGFQNVDYALVAARASALQAGIYWRAFQLGVVYQDKVSGVMLRLAFPVYSRTKDLGELRVLHERVTRVHAAVIFPFLAAFIVIAPELVPFLFGPEWRGAIEPSRILAGAGMVAAVLTGFPQVMLAAGQPRRLLRFNLGFLALYATVVALAIPAGIVAVAIGVTAVYVAMLFGVYAALLRPVLGIPLRRLGSDLGPALSGSAAVVAAGFPIRAALVSAGVPDLGVIAVVPLVCLPLYAVALRIAAPALWRDLATLVARVGGGASRRGGRPDPKAVITLAAERPA
jgi:O-antigen/teichoic acid export membrane protein